MIVLDVNTTLMMLSDYWKLILFIKAQLDGLLLIQKEHVSLCIISFSISVLFRRQKDRLYWHWGKSCSYNKKSTWQSHKSLWICRWAHFHVRRWWWTSKVMGFENHLKHILSQGSIWCYYWLKIRSTTHKYNFNLFRWNFGHLWC